MDRLQEAIKLAAKIREESFDNKASQQAINDNRIVDHNQFYSKSLHEAADEAAEAVGFDKRGTFPIYALLKHSWNESLDWANNNQR